jgi:hypothetical protein
MGYVDFIILGGLMPGLELETINNRNSKKMSFIKLVYIISTDFKLLHGYVAC